jgi:phospholipid/cholesterol/gamma-HCH transport system ATP-binding protein
VIEFKKVFKSFGSKQVLAGMSFEVARGEVVFLLGRSGAGKSVCLKHLVGLVKPDRGEVWVDGQQVNQLDEAQFFDVRRKCGMVFQFPALLDSLSVYENIAFGLRAHNAVAPQDQRVRVVETLALVKLGESILEKFPSQLSFGMQKRVSIARTLAIRPQYLLFDEPTTSLDPVSSAAIHALIGSLSRSLGVTALVVSHDMEGALSVADRILLVDEGRVVDQGTPSQMRSSKNSLTRDFLR